MWMQQAEAYISRVVFVIVRLLFFVFFIRFFVLEFGLVSGPSMLPGLHDGQVFMLLKIPYYARSPERFEVVQIVSPENDRRVYIKRVIGLPGEIVSFKRNQVCIRSAEAPAGILESCLYEPYLSETAINTVPNGKGATYTVPKDTYFVLGDNRMSSADSREFGPVKRDRILGLVFPL